MDYRIETYERWAPFGALWTQWAKPVLFSSYPNRLSSIFKPSKVTWMNHVDYKTMIIVDVEGEAGVKEGVAYAKMGYRPVPLYNGVRGESQSRVVNVDNLQSALFAASQELEECVIAPDAPPVFLLDSKRMTGYKYIDIFDNRWVVFPQDMPSASFIKQNGIEKIVVRSDGIQDDLSHILFRYQKEGLVVYLCKSKDDVPTKITVKRPSRFKSLRYRFSVMLGLKRNSTGGFGSFIPEPSQHRSGYGYRGIG